jgi:signal transduction histidine kinase
LVTELKGAAVLSWGVPPDLRFALENVMQNAMRYSRPGGEVRVGLHVSGEKATISVADRGIGIPKELQHDVFLEFVRAPNAKHHAPQGTGLGLTIVKEAVEMHGGSVLLQSKEGVGTTVTVQLLLRNSLPPGVRLVTPNGKAEERAPA